MVYDPSLTVSKIRAELDKKVKSEMDVGVVIVDYINQVKRSSNAFSWRAVRLDRTDRSQQGFEGYGAGIMKPLYFAPYQTDASGGARFAKGILDAADAAYYYGTLAAKKMVVCPFTVRKDESRRSCVLLLLQWTGRV